MRIATVGLILFCVGISAGAQIALKAGMTARDIRTVIESGDYVRIATALITSPLVMLGLVTYGLSAIIWMFVLSRVALSTAYPFIALGIAMTSLFLSRADDSRQDCRNWSDTGGHSGHRHRWGWRASKRSATRPIPQSLAGFHSGTDMMFTTFLEISPIVGPAWTLTGRCETVPIATMRSK
ncbi:MAG: hypothetical protein IPP45_13365 [Sphingomonadales bacterium]|nr:hypothetical protein [Sphingomonadales bacterium]